MALPLPRRVKNSNDLAADKSAANALRRVEVSDWRGPAHSAQNHFFQARLSYAALASNSRFQLRGVAIVVTESAAETLFSQDRLVGFLFDRDWDD